MDWGAEGGGHQQFGFQVFGLCCCKLAIAVHESGGLQSENPGSIPYFPFLGKSQHFQSKNKLAHHPVVSKKSYTFGS